MARQAAYTPGPISTVWELSLSESWLRYMAPTCSAGPRWVCIVNGRGGSTRFAKIVIHGRRTAANPEHMNTGL